MTGEKEEKKEKEKDKKEEKERKFLRAQGHTSERQYKRFWRT